jgi:hypothetical protein
VARRLNVSPATVYRTVGVQILHGKKMGVSGCLRVSSRSVAEFEKRREYAEEV